MKKYLFIGSVILVIASACNREGCTDPRADNFDKQAQIDDGTCEYSTERAERLSQFKSQLATIAYATYKDAHEDALLLQSEVESFLNFTTEQNFTFCREAWLLTRETYSQTVVFPFLLGQYDESAEMRIDAWPINPSRIDYTNGDDSRGIINQVQEYPDLNAQLLTELHQEGGPLNATIGSHVIELLLWGVDPSDTLDDKFGNRGYKDYLIEDGNHENQERRRAYLKIATQLYVDDITELKDSWDPDIAGNTRSAFLALPGEEALANVLAGLGHIALRDLAELQMGVAIAEPDSIAEQSDFSDYSDRDIIQNARAMDNVYNGRYTSIYSERYSGPSMHEVIALEYDTIAAGLITGFAECLKDCQEISPPFDARAYREAVSGSGKGSISKARQTLTETAQTIQRAIDDMALDASF
ncbi:MAG: hypothetical protein Salg2KO_22010 [Salibacteraceae bacterium]